MYVIHLQRCDYQSCPFPCAHLPLHLSRNHLVTLHMRRGRSSTTHGWTTMPGLALQPPQQPTTTANSLAISSWNTWLNDHERSNITVPATTHNIVHRFIELCMYSQLSLAVPRHNFLLECFHRYIKWFYSTICHPVLIKDPITSHANASLHYRVKSITL